eukprot:TRINITY_DN28975_c0_g2_i1.p1 TRINITY_DN28975_c0_g2~~TRINITY_DN28975_c0_g2_i1.p1  ORF type:complete len:397 (-),score=102.42 TRINITY_DN28975_c0_g2_i1:54-1217(-)
MASVARRGGDKEATLSFFEALYASQETEGNRIDEGLFLGSAAAGEDREALQKRRITHILVCHPTLPFAHPRHFKYARVPIPDDPAANLLELLPDALEFLCGARRSGGSVLIYCMKGISRSGSCAVALLMFERRLGFDEAWRCCEQRRPIVYPNIGFQEQLRQLERLLAADANGAAASAAVGADASTVAERLQRLRVAVPRGSLVAPESPLPIRARIADAMRSSLNEVETLARRCRAKPQLLAQQALWKRHGLYFENVHKYKALPSDAALIGRARSVADALASLAQPPRNGADAKLAAMLAREIESWIALVGPALQREDAELRRRSVAQRPNAAGSLVAGAYDDEPAAEAPASAPLLAGAYDSSSSDGEDPKGPAGDNGGRRDRSRSR